MTVENVKVKWVIKNGNTHELKFEQNSSDCSINIMEDMVLTLSFNYSFLLFIVIRPIWLFWAKLVINVRV